MAIQFFRHLQGYAILRCDIYVHLGVDPSQLQYTILTKSQRCRPCDSNAATTAQAARPAPSPSCSGGNDSSAVCPAPPRLFRVATTTTAQPRTLPRPVSFVQQRRRQLSRAPCLAPSPSCGDNDDRSAARPAPPHLLRAAAATTAQPRAPPRPISFVQWRRRQLSRAPCLAPSPSCGDNDDSSAARPAFMPRQRRQLRPRAPPRLLRAAAATTAQAVRPAPSPSCSGGGNSSAARPALPHLLRAAAATTTQPRALPRPVSFVQRRRRQLSRVPCPAPSPSCGADDDSSAARPAFMQRRRRQRRPRAPPRLLRAAAATTAQAVRPAPSPSCGGGGDSSAARPALPHLLRVATATTAQDARPAPSPSCSGVLSPTLGDEIVLRLCIPLALKLAYIKAIGQPIGFDWSCLEFNMGVRAWTRGVGDKGSGGRDGEGCVCCRSLQYSL